MGKTMELRMELRERMTECCTNVHYEEAPNPYKYPYLVFELQELSCTDNKTDMQMEVNAIDYGDNTERIENISDRVQDVFNGLHVLTAGLHFSVYKDKRQSVQETDKYLIRRRMLFEIHLHERR